MAGFYGDNGFKQYQKNGMIFTAANKQRRTSNMRDLDCTLHESSPHVGRKICRTNKNDAPSPTHEQGNLKCVLPPLGITYDPKAYIDWEIAVDNEFRKYDLSEKQKIKAATSVLNGFTLIWWNTRKEGQPHSWNAMKRFMRDMYVPDYHADFLNTKLQRLKQGNKSVKNYFEQLQNQLLRCGLGECEEATKLRFLRGLNQEIQNILVNKNYNSLSHLVKLACKAENHILEEIKMLDAMKEEVSKFHEVVCAEEDNSMDNLHALVSPSSTNLLQEIEKNEEIEVDMVEHGTFPSTMMLDVVTPLKSTSHVQIVVDGNCAIAGPRSVATEVFDSPFDDVNLSVEQPPLLEKNDGKISVVGQEHATSMLILHEEELLATPETSENNNKGNNGVGSVVIHREEVSSCNNICAESKISFPEFNIPDLQNVELITHDKVLSKAFQDESLCYVLFDEPIELSCMIDKVAKISSSKSLDSTCKFYLSENYGVNNNFHVRQIFITTDLLADLKLNSCNTPSIVSYCGSSWIKKLFDDHCSEKRSPLICSFVTCESLVTNLHCPNKSSSLPNNLTQCLVKLRTTFFQAHRIDEKEWFLIKTIDAYIYHAYTLFFLSSTFADCQKTLTCIREEGKNVKIMAPMHMLKCSFFWNPVRPLEAHQDFMSYFVIEDELESRTTPNKEGENDEDITTSDTPMRSMTKVLPCDLRPMIIMQGPNTRASAS